MQTAKLLARTLSFLVGLYFALAALHKVLNPGSFIKLVSLLPVLPNMPFLLRAIVAGVLVGLELFVSFGCITGVRRRLSLQVACVLLAVFTLLAAPFYEALGGDCGCTWAWVPLAPTSGLGVIFRNLALGTAALWVLWSQEDLFKESLSRTRRAIQYCVAVILVGALSGGTWVSLLAKGYRVQRPRPTPDDVSSSTGTAEGQHNPAIDASTPRETLQPSRSEVTELSREARFLRILSESNTPVVGARAYVLESWVVMSPSEYAGWPADRGGSFGESDSDGYLRLPDGMQEQPVAIQSSGFQPVLIPNLAVALRSPVVLALQNERGIRVVSPSGDAVEGARILVEVRSWDWLDAPPSIQDGLVDWSTTGLDGIGRVPVAPIYRARGAVAASGYALQPITIGEGTPATLQLTSAAQVSGAVTGDVPSALILAEPARENSGFSFVTELDSSGRFTIPGLSEGKPWILTACASRERLLPIGPSVEVIPPADDVYVETDPGATVDLLARDERGTPLQPRLLAALFPEKVLADFEQARQTEGGGVVWTDIRVAAPHESILWVHAPGFLPKCVGRTLLRPGERTSLGEVELLRSSTWTVTVTDSDGDPVEGAWVNFIPQRTSSSAPGSDWMQSEQTGADGVGRLLSLDGVAGILSVRKNGWLPHNQEILTGEARGETSVSLTRPATVIVHCLNLDGEPMPGASVSWKCPGEVSGLVRSDREGTATVECPPGMVEIRASTRAVHGRIGSSEIEFELGSYASEPASVGPVLSGRVEHLDLQFPTQSIHLSLVIGNEPAAGYRVAVLPGCGVDPGDSDVWALAVPRGVTDVNGQCTLENVALGDSTFFVSSSEGLRWKVEKVVDARYESIELPTREVRVLALDATGSPIPGFPVRLTAFTSGGLRLPRLESRSPTGRSTRMGVSDLSATRVTGDDGYALFVRVPDLQELRIECAEPDRFPGVAAVLVGADSKETFVTLRSGSGAALQLLVRTRAGFPARGIHARVTSMGDQTRASQEGETGVDGGLHFGALDSGTWKVILFPPGYEVDVLLRPGEHVVKEVLLPD